MPKQLNLKIINSLLSHLMIGAYKYGSNFTNRLFYLHEKVVFMCILPNFGAKLAVQV